MLEITQLSVGRNGNVVATIEQLAVQAGEVVAFVGVSGCGKTTALLTIAGAIPAIGGKLLIDGEERSPVWRSKNTALTHQSFPLLHWLSVKQNLQLACKIRGVRSEGLDKVLDSFRAGQLANRMPGSLSGGERCRASLAQAVVARPRLMLLDEPFTGLDSIVKEEVADSLFAFARRERVGVLLVTHDLYDAASFASRAVVLAGRPSRIVLDLATSEPQAVGRVKQALHSR